MPSASAARVLAEAEPYRCIRCGKPFGTLRAIGLRQSGIRRLFLLEGFMLGCYAIGCNHGYIYVRGEMMKGYARLRQALAEARARATGK